jgi:2-polyprenyl-3-methyl-5-hydroxy-6-metoxy-1,4-benzoquinol methylase
MSAPMITASATLTPRSQEPNKLAEIRSHERDSRDRPAVRTKPFHLEWGSQYWIKWGAIAYALGALDVKAGCRVLDVGCGQGWTSVFLAESGFDVTGIDIAGANVRLAEDRARRWGLESARFIEADMDDFAIDEQFDLVLVFDALHHTARQSEVIANLARQLAPGGWIIFGEPSLLHGVSPEARRVHRDAGWIERGVGVRRLRRDCSAVGLGKFRRFFEGVGPYESRLRVFAWQLARLVGANFALAPQASIWVAAQRIDGGGPGGAGADRQPTSEAHDPIAA